MYLVMWKVYPITDVAQWHRTGSSSDSLSANSCRFNDRAYLVGQFSSEGGPIFGADLRQVGFRQSALVAICHAYSMHTRGNAVHTKNVCYRTQDGRLHPVTVHPGQITHHTIKV